uniref:GPI transamidase component GAB1 n=1 Tax=Caenorhabditis tropicalis TaxID=1561998 RepID=A0A1I7T441_9PELO
MAEGKGIQTKQKESLVDFLFPISAAIAVRSVSAAYSDFFDERVEFTSPIYSFERLKDGISMLEDNVDPFETKNMHFPPITLHLFRFLLNSARSLLLPLWIIIDVATALMTAKAAETIWERFHGEEETENMKRLVFILYAFNPITIVSTGILSLTVLQNFVFAAIFLFSVTDRPALCAVLIGAWSSFTIYPSILISCLVFRSNGSALRFMSLLLMSALSASAFIGINFVFNGNSLNFFESVYMSILNFTNIQPNVGLYWYFFVQIFEHFRSFYTSSFVILFFFMPIPITLMIRRDSILHFTIISLLVSIFFPYPTLNQVSVAFAILPLHEAYKKHFRYTILITGTIVTTIALMPVMWHMWMVSSSGNANFFFGATIVYNIALINLVMDMIFVYSRQQIDLEYKDTLKEKTKMDFAFY